MADIRKVSGLVACGAHRSRASDVGMLAGSIDCLTFLAGVERADTQMIHIRAPHIGLAKDTRRFRRNIEGQRAALLEVCTTALVAQENRTRGSVFSSSQRHDVFPAEGTSGRDDSVVATTIASLSRVWLIRSLTNGWHGRKTRKSGKDIRSRKRRRGRCWWSRYWRSRCWQMGRRSNRNRRNRSWSRSLASQDRVNVVKMSTYT